MVGSQSGFAFHLLCLSSDSQPSWNSSAFAVSESQSWSVLTDNRFENTRVLHLHAHIIIQETILLLQFLEVSVQNQSGVVCWIVNITTFHEGTDMNSGQWHVFRLHNIDPAIVEKWLISFSGTLELILIKVIQRSSRSSQKNGSFDGTVSTKRVAALIEVRTLKRKSS